MHPRRQPVCAITGCEQAQQDRYLLDDLVGGGEQRWRDVEAERLRRLEVDDKLVFGRRLHRQIGGLFAFEDAIDIAGGEAIRFGLIDPVGDQPALSNIAAERIDRWQLVVGSGGNDRIALNFLCTGSNDDQAAIPSEREGRNGALNLVGTVRDDGVNSTPNDGATAWIAPNCATSIGLAGFRTTATRATRGATCLSNSSNFALRPNSTLMKPVALPPGRDRLAT